MEGLDDSYWVAAGVARDDSSLFSYSGGQTMGFASNGVILGVTVWINFSPLFALIKFFPLMAYVSLGRA